MSTRFKEFIMFVQHFGLVLGEYDHFLSEAQITCISPD